MSHSKGTYTNIVLKSLDGMELSEFADITVLKVAMDDTIIVLSTLHLDVSGLRHLKSLELRIH